MGIVPSNGRSSRGKRAVTAIGTVSVIHHRAIQTVSAKTFQAVAGMSRGGGINIRATNNSGPRTSPISLRRALIW
jgi:hypothetical protein